MGIPFKTLGKYAESLKLVFVSHQHGDHMNLATIKKLHMMRPTVRFCVGDYLYKNLINIGISKNNIDIIKPNRVYDYKILKLSPFILFHDLKNQGLRIFDKGEKILYATDTKSINHVTAKSYDYYFLEGNYSEEKILDNIKNAKDSWEIYYCQRAQETHLSIEQASNFLLDNMGEHSQYRLIHTSENNA